MSGKTELLAALEGLPFSGVLPQTIGAAFSVIRFREGETEHRLILWDTAGQEKYRSLLPIYTRRADVLLLAVDMSRDDWLGALGEGLGAFTRGGEGCKSLVLVGTKTDLLEPETRIKREAELEAFAQSIGAASFGASALRGTGVQALSDFLRAEAVALCGMRG